MTIDGNRPLNEYVEVGRGGRMSQDERQCLGVSAEVSALMHHVELHKQGWWDRTLEKTAFAVVWLAKGGILPGKVKDQLAAEFNIIVAEAKVSSVIAKLCNSGTLSRMPGGVVCVPPQERAIFEKQVEAAELAERAAHDFFLKLMTEQSEALATEAVWCDFQQFALIPLVARLGASAYGLIVGQHLEVDGRSFEKFTARYPEKDRAFLHSAAVNFLDPAVRAATDYVARLVHGNFCIRTIGLPTAAIERLKKRFGADHQIRVFVDTNLLFSLLELHENACNTSTQELVGVLRRLDKTISVKLQLLPRTRDEAVNALSKAQAELLGLSPGRNFAIEPKKIDLGGIAARYMTIRNGRTGSLSADEWLGPYLDNLVAIAEGRGVSYFNENLDEYAVRQDVIDDILATQKFERDKKVPRPKTYEQLVKRHTIGTTPRHN